MRFKTLAAGVVTVLALGCDAEVTIISGLIHPDCAAQAWVEVVPLDVWGRTVTGAQISGHSDGAQVELPVGSQVTWDVSVDGLKPSNVAATWSGEGDGGALSVSATDSAAVAVSLDVLNVGEKGCRVYTVFVGLDHPWYAAGGRAPRAGNKVALLMDGEEYWAAVHADLTAPGPAKRVHQSTWWWMSDFELVRADNHHEVDPAERWKTTMLSVLENRGGMNRLNVARFAEETAPGMAYLNTDPLVRAHGLDHDDDFELILQGNPTAAPIFEPYAVPARPFSFVSRVYANPLHQWRSFHHPIGKLTAALSELEASSYHQKALIIDDNIAYISGMNVKSTDWDSNDHRVFDHRRMMFNATREEREAVMARKALPDMGPRKDYGLRVEGPAARDLDDILRVRWDHALATGAMFEGDATPYSLLDRAPAVGEVTAQIVTTLPEPIQERSILETLLKASRNATDFIYIEDQYWRAPILHEAMLAAMEENPDLYLIVVTKPIPLVDGGKKYTVVADETFRNAYPDRYLLLQLKTFDREGDEIYFQNVDTHSKIQIVDDVYLNVGSANKNNRGLLYEGELNGAVHDRPFVSGARNRVLANLVGADHADEVRNKSGAEVYAALKALAEKNAEVEATLSADPHADVAPQGFVYPLVITPEYLLDVGPDVF